MTNTTKTEMTPPTKPATDKETTMPTTQITDAQIEALRAEAGTAGDLEQVAICDRALDGDEQARTECARVIADATARE